MKICKKIFGVRWDQSGNELLDMKDSLIEWDDAFDTYPMNEVLAQADAAEHQIEVESALEYDERPLRDEARS